MNRGLPSHRSGAICSFSTRSGYESVDLIVRIAKEMEAIRLIELGARASLVCQLTGLEKKVVRRLYRQLVGSPSPSGQMPFTDTWYVRDERLMLHASVFWKLYQQVASYDYTPARTLIEVYQAYRTLVNRPLLNIMRAYFVTRLVTMQIWHERHCRYCTTAYLSPIDWLGPDCHGCELYFGQRCRHCGARVSTQGKGRPRKHCHACKRVL